MNSALLNLIEVFLCAFWEHHGTCGGVIASSWKSRLRGDSISELRTNLPWSLKKTPWHVGDSRRESQCNRCVLVAHAGWKCLCSVARRMSKRDFHTNKTWLWDGKKAFKKAGWKCLQPLSLCPPWNQFWALWLILFSPPSPFLCLPQRWSLTIRSRRGCWNPNWRTRSPTHCSGSTGTRPRNPTCARWLTLERPSPVQVGCFPTPIMVMQRLPGYSLLCHSNPPAQN